jgi:hypothetical protein
MLVVEYILLLCVPDFSRGIYIAVVCAIYILAVEYILLLLFVPNLCASEGVVALYREAASLPEPKMVNLSAVVSERKSGKKVTR